MKKNVFQDDNKKRNKELLSGFGDYLAASGISEKTVNGHIRNIDTYINIYLSGKKILKVEEGYKYIDEYFSEWFGKETLNSTALLKQKITSLKKFYSYLYETGVIDHGMYRGMEEIIKEKRSGWIAGLEYRDILDINDRDKEILSDFYSEINKYITIAPWKWLSDNEIFAVKLKDEDEIYFCCVLGNARESYGLSIYKGAAGLDSYLRVLSGDFDSEDEVITFNKCIVINLDTKRYLEDLDLEIIKLSSVVFNDKSKLPYVRIYNPGYFPGGLDLKNTSIFNRILKVVNPFVTYLKHNMDKAYLIYEGIIIVREYGDEDALVNEFEMSIENYFSKNSLDIDIPIVYDDITIQKLKRSCKKSPRIWEVDIFNMIQPVEDNDEIIYPEALMMVDTASGMIVGYDMVSPGKTEDLQIYVIDLLNELKILPAKVIVKHSVKMMYLDRLFEKLGIQIDKVKKLNVIPQIKKELFDNIQNM